MNMKKYKIVSYKRFICSQLVMMLILFVTISNLKQVCANVLQEKTAQHKIQIQNTVSTQEIYVEKKFQLANSSRGNKTNSQHKDNKPKLESTKNIISKEERK